MAIAAIASMQTGEIKTTMDGCIVMVRMAVITDRAIAMDVFTTRDEYMSETCGEICRSFCSNQREIVRLEHSRPNGLCLLAEQRMYPVNHMQRKNAKNAAIVR